MSADPITSHMEHCRTLVDAQPHETLADAIERLIAGQKSLSVDKIMEVVKWGNKNFGNSGADAFYGSIRERLNKLIG